LQSLFGSRLIPISLDAGVTGNKTGNVTDGNSANSDAKQTNKLILSDLGSFEGSIPSSASIAVRSAPLAP
jgi:hypothetical protein